MSQNEDKTVANLFALKISPWQINNETTSLEANGIQGIDSPKGTVSAETQKVKKSFGFILKLKLTVIKEIFHELAKEIQCECFPKIFKDNTHLVNKLIWTLLFFIFSGLTCYLLTRDVLDYFRQKKVIRMGFETSPNKMQI